MRIKKYRRFIAKDYGQKKKLTVVAGAWLMLFNVHGEI